MVQSAKPVEREQDDQPPRWETEWRNQKQQTGYDPERPPRRPVIRAHRPSRSREHEARYDDVEPDHDFEDHQMRTKFHPWEAGSNEGKFRRLNNKKWGHRKRHTKRAERHADRQNDLSTWASQLDLTEYQREWALVILDAVDLTALNGYSFGNMEAILAILLHVQAADGREPIEIESITDEGIEASPEDENFAKIIDGLGVEASTVARVRSMLRDQFDGVGGGPLSFK